MKSPEEERIELFTKFVQYLQGKGIRVVFLLSPYHPIAYDNAMEKRRALQRLCGPQSR